MNEQFTYISPTKKKIEDKFKENIIKCISIFFIISLSWFGYSMYKLIIELI